MNPAGDDHAAIVGEVLDATRFLAESLIRPDLTIWDAFEEAIRWWTADQFVAGGDDGRAQDLPWEDPDPLRTALDQLLKTQPAVGAVDGHALGDLMTSALSNWLGEMADRHNDGRSFSPLLASSWPAVLR